MKRLASWHKADADSVHSDVLATVEAIRAQQELRTQQIQDAWTTYGQQPKHLWGITEVTGPDGGSVPVNVLSEVVDAYVAMFIRSRPRVLNVPVGGGYTAKRKAEDRTKFLDGVWYRTRLRRDARMCGKEAAISGTGILKVFGDEDASEIEHERVLPEELWADDEDARYGMPRNLFQRRYVDRERLAALYPEHASDIETAQAGTRQADRVVGYATEADQVLVTEAWHLPAGKDTKDGRHVIAIDTCSLVDEAWDWHRFPFALLSFEPVREGIWGEGIVKKIEDLQAWINDIVKQIVANVRQFGKNRIYLERGSKINKAQITDDYEADIVEFTGTPPKTETAVAVPADVFALLRDLRAQAFQRIGLSQMQSSGELPRGIEHAPAARMSLDIQSTRLMPESHAWEDWHLDVAALDLAVADDLVGKGKVSAVYQGRRYGSEYAAKIEYWKPEEGEEYVLRAYPTNLIPDDPTGRLAALGELEDRGYLTREEVLDQLDLPDIKRAYDIRSAGIRAIEWYLSRMLDGEDFPDGRPYNPPEPTLPLQLALAKAQAAYNLGRLDEVSEDKLALVLQWIDEVKMLLQDANPPPQPGPAGPPMPPMPPAGPMPPGGAQ